MIIVSPSQLNDSILLKLNGKLGLGNVIILFRKGSTHSFMYLKTCIHPCGWQLVPVIGLQWSLLLHMLKCLLVILILFVKRLEGYVILFFSF